MADGVEFTIEYHIDGRVFDDPREFIRALQVTVQAVHLEATAKYILHFAHQIYANLVRLSGVRTGRLRRGWRVEWRVLNLEGGYIAISNPKAWYWVVVNGGDYIDEAIEAARRHTLSVFKLGIDGNIPSLRGVVSG